MGFTQALEFSGGDVAALENGARSQQVGQGGDDQRAALVHAQGRNLHHQNIFVLINNQAAEEIAFGVDHSIGGRVQEVFFSESQRLTNSLLEEWFVDLDPLGSQEAHMNL